MRFLRPSFLVGASATVYTAVNGLDILISVGFSLPNIGIQPDGVVERRWIWDREYSRALQGREGVWA